MSGVVINGVEYKYHVNVYGFGFGGAYSTEFDSAQATKEQQDHIIKLFNELIEKFSREGGYLPELNKLKNTPIGNLIKASPFNKSGKYYLTIDNDLVAMLYQEGLAELISSGGGKRRKSKRRKSSKRKSSKKRITKRRKSRKRKSRRRR